LAAATVLGCSQPQGRPGPALAESDRALDAPTTFLTSAIFLLSVGAAFFGLPVAVVFWVVLLPAGRMLIVRALARDGTASRAAADGID
jgi:multisubunit Na+/H+ antiporter MnhG subunit